jgi:hypothetical protein
MSLSLILAAVLLLLTGAEGYHRYSYDTLVTFAGEFESAVMAAHDGSPPNPTQADCDRLASLFSPSSSIVSGGIPFTQQMFCYLWVQVGVTTHTTDFTQRFVESNVVPITGQQTIGWWVVDTGVRDNGCAFTVPNIAWARIDSNVSRNDPPLIQYLEFVTDSQAPCF